MSNFDLAALFIALVALGGWLNARTLKLPHAVAMLFVGLLGALAVYGLSLLRPDLASGVAAGLGRVDFPKTVLGYMLAFLLFAGAMQVDLPELRRRRIAVWTLATLGVLASTVIVGVGLWAIARSLGLLLTLPWALVFGALISPTDPIAVLATVKRGHLSPTLQTVLKGEALFNDGIGIVVFTALLAFASGQMPDPRQAALDVVIQAGGGLALGALSAWAVIRAMRMIDDYVVEVSLTVALAMGVYAGGQALHLSGPIAVVGAGLLVGDGGARKSMSEATAAHLNSFWTLIDEMLNALLFFMLGLQLLVLPLVPRQAGLCAAAILLVLATRFAVVLPWGSWLNLRHEQHGANLALAWGGLHGALSLALALSVPAGPQRPLILAAAYAVAIFSVAVQGLTFGPLAAALQRRAATRSARA